MKDFKTGIIICFLSALAPLYVSGAVIRVPADQPDLWSAVAVACDGDTILVADGIYGGELNSDITIAEKRLAIMSENGPESCIIESYGTDRRCFTVRELTGASVIQGFSFKKFTASSDEFSAITLSPALIKPSDMKPVSEPISAQVFSLSGLS